MSSLPRRFFVFSALAIWITFPAMAQSPDISGSYLAKGRNPDGTAYNGVAEISQTANQVSVAWAVGNQNYTGRGERDGRVVTVYWGQEAPVIYVLTDNGELHGTWAQGTALERLIPQ